MSQRLPLYRQPSPYAAYIAAHHPLDSPELFAIRDNVKAFLYQVIDEADLHAETVDILQQVLSAAESEPDIVQTILRAALSAAEAEYAAARACCYAHAALLPTAIHILPPAIMTRIFHELVPPLSHGPWWLMHVCRRWRAMVTSCPTLWASFSIRAPNDGSRVVKEEPLLRALAYSRSEPLTFRAPIGYLSSRLLRELVSSSPRWRNVSLDQCMALDLEESLILLELKELTLCDSEAGFTPTVLNFFNEAPSLRKLTLRGRTASFPVDVDLLQQVTCNFPWMQITELSVALEHSWMSYLFLSACPNLISFRDDSRVDKWEHREDWPLVVRDELRELHSRNAGLLLRLSCPRLDKLSLRTGRDLENVIAVFLGRSSSSPKHIVLETDSSSAALMKNDIEHLLDELNDTSVTDLTIQSNNGLQMMHIIDFVASHCHIFPNLVRVGIQCEHPPERCVVHEDDRGHRSICGGAWIPEHSIYELRVRNSWMVKTVSVDVFFTGTTVPPCIDKVFSHLRESSTTYKVSTWHV